jgi:hypothetical protein
LIAAASLAAALALQSLLLNSFTRSSLYLISSESFVLLGIGAVLWALLNGQSLLGNPIYLAILSYVLFIGAGPLVGTLGGLPLEITASPESALYSWLAFTALGGGYWFWKLAARERRASFSGNAEINLKTLRWMGIAYTVVGVGGIVFYLQSLGTADYLLNASYLTRGGISGYYNSALGLLRPGFFLLFVWATAKKRVGLGWAAVLIAYCLLDLLWFGPIRGSRHHIITLVLSVMCLMKQSCAWRARPRLRAIPLAWVAALGLALVLVWGGLRDYSFTQIAEGEGRLNAAEDMRSTVFESLYDPYDTYARIVDAAPNFVPFLGGSSFYESLTVLIPRDLWSSKPKPLGDWLSITLYGVLPTAGNSVPTWPGEFYLNFGLPGLMAGMFAMGALCAWLGRCAPSPAGESNASLGRVLFYGTTFPIVFDMMHQGTNGLVWFLFTNTGPVCFAIWLAGIRGRRRSAAEISSACPDRVGAFVRV